MNAKSKDRSWIIEMGVRFESSISWTIAQKLGISPVDSISFGSGSQSLGFSQRMNLLVDMKMLSKTEKAKFQEFMFIRNKFAHVWDIDSLQRLFIKYPQPLKFIEKKYHSQIEKFRLEYYESNKSTNPKYDLKINDPERYFVGCMGIFMGDIHDMIERIQKEVIEGYDNK